jgi:hypothetical protein
VRSAAQNGFRPASRVAGSVAIIVSILLSAAPPVLAGLTEALRLYERAEKKLETGDYQEALELAKAAIAEHPDSTETRVGMFTKSYFPHFLMARIYDELGDPDTARIECRKELDAGVIQNNKGEMRSLTTLLSTLEQVDPEPPRIERAEATIIETEFAAGDRKGFEQAVIELSGSVFDRGGIRSITAAGQRIRFKATDVGVTFKDRVRIDAAAKSVKLVVEDSSDRVTTRSIAVDIPPLDLGPAAGSIHAVLVGIDRYETAVWSENGVCRPELQQRCADPGRFACYPVADLGAAAGDAERFADLLLRRGVPQRNIELITSKRGSVKATRENVLRALSRARGIEAGTLIFFFAGHGVHSAGKKNLLLLSDTRGWECLDGPAPERDDLEATSISVEEVEQALMESHATERYVFLDACRTLNTPGTRGVDQSLPGFDVRGVAVVPGDLQPEPESTAPVVVYATQERKVSVEWQKRRAGYFTWFLLQALRRDFDLDQLSRFVQDRVREQTAADLCPEGAQEECMGIQVPVVDWPKELGEDFRLRRNTHVLR